MKQYVFGYGSLMNPRSLQKTLPGKVVERRVCLSGYCRKFNVPIEGYLYLNIVPEKGSTLEGVLVVVSDDDLEKLKKREAGYECIEVTRAIEESVAGRIFAFIAPNRDYPDMKILQSYVNTCLQGVPESEREPWLKETIIINQVEDDTTSPRYPNVD